MIKNLKQTQGLNPFTEIVGNAKSGIVLIADHASNKIPDTYGTLGLPQSELSRHIAYDIGVEGLTKLLAKQLDAPAILSNFSRLLIDPNRGELDPTLIMQLSDGSVIPGNYPLEEAERKNRIERYYRPYDNAVGNLIEKVENACGKSPLVISIHSFTPIWRGKPRPWHIGLLWDSDPRVFTPLYQELKQREDILVGDNEPYDGALKGDTMYRHCTQNGIAHILIEIRQDFISDEESITNCANYLSPIMQKINQLPMIHMKQYFPSRCD